MYVAYALFWINKCISRNIWKKATTGTYTHLVGRLVNSNVHQIYKHSSNWILFYLKKNLTDVVYHEKGHGDDTLSYSRSVTLSRTKTTEWSANTSITTNTSVKIAEILEVGVSTTVGAGYGETYAQGKSFTSASEVTKQIKDSAPTGYYTRVPGYTFYKMHWTISTTPGGAISFKYGILGASSLFSNLVSLHNLQQLMGSPSLSNFSQAHSIFLAKYCSSVS